ncbi:MAG: hypothetical protein AAGA12_13675 [Pseudomonadota bacterium]
MVGAIPPKAIPPSGVIGAKPPTTAEMQAALQRPASEMRIQESLMRSRTSAETTGAPMEPQEPDDVPILGADARTVVQARSIPIGGLSPSEPLWGRPEPLIAVADEIPDKPLPGRSKT